jgi:hypothetical protein
MQQSSGKEQKTLAVEHCNLTLEAIKQLQKSLGKNHKGVGIILINALLCTRILFFKGQELYHSLRRKGIQPRITKEQNQTGPAKSNKSAGANHHLQGLRVGMYKNSLSLTKQNSYDL